MNHVIDNMIVGLGVTGLSVARFLHAQNLSFKVVDNYANQTQIDELKNETGTSVSSDKFSTELLSSAKRLIVSPGVSVQTKMMRSVQQSGTTIIGDIELFAQEMSKYRAKVVAVTGSNGKSTCVSLLSEMAKMAGLRVKLGGNIGTPALDLLNDFDTELFILELSSFQLETTHSLNCTVSAVLNISKDHLDRYENFTAYINAKKRLITQSQQVVVFKEDDTVNDWGQIKFTENAPQKNEYGIVDGWLKRGEDFLIKTADIKLKGKHNQANALACLAMGDALGLPSESMFEALRSFKGLAHRSEFVANIDGVDWINDSKATNVGATLAAIDGFNNDKNIILLAGGQTKGADIRELKPLVKQAVKVAILFGTDARLINNVIKHDTDCRMVESLDEACVLAKSLAVSDDVVLLSPAGASFDMFDNFIARGKAFVKIVEHLK